MSANLDRFSCGFTPAIPDEVGYCAACGGMMYDYEAIKCPACDADIHQSCIENCEGNGDKEGKLCGQVGCRACLNENEEGLLLCENCSDRLALSKLTESDKGRWVIYIPEKGEKKIGRIKSWNRNWVFVVYHCAGEWDSYEHYTAAATNPNQLYFLDNSEVKNDNRISKTN